MIHNVLVPQYSNPERKDKNDTSYESPQYKHRHRSGTTNFPQSSPIKVEDYEAELIMTP